MVVAVRNWSHQDIIYRGEGRQANGLVEVGFCIFILFKSRRQAAIANSRLIRPGLSEAGSGFNGADRAIERRNVSHPFLPYQTMGPARTALVARLTIWKGDATGLSDGAPWCKRGER